MLSKSLEETLRRAMTNASSLKVDRSVKPAHGKVIIAVLDGQMTVKRLYKRSGKIILMPENDLYKPIEIQDHMNMEIWGVVTSSVHFL